MQEITRDILVSKANELLQAPVLLTGSSAGNAENMTMMSPPAFSTVRRRSKRSLSGTASAVQTFQNIL